MYVYIYIYIYIYIYSNIEKILFSSSRLLFSQNFFNSFINSAVNDFQRSKECGDQSCIILPSLLEFTNPFIPYCELNEIKSKYQNIFLKNLLNSLQSYFKIVIT